MNPRSGLVIGAETSTHGTVLTVAKDNNSSRQAWSAGNYTQPTINYISGFLEMCLQANGANARVWLTKCVIGTVPSIILLKCQGWGNQRWTFMADGTILNPNAWLVMDVRRNDVSLQEIIMYQPTGNPNQNWLAF
nr:ribosome-inactivating protein [Tanacetum cinerariifolium]